MRRRPIARAQLRTAEAGASILELLVSALLVAIVMVVSLTAFDSSSRVTQVQIDIADLQQNVRVAQRDVARYLRMAGRGGLPRASSTRVEQNVSAGTVIGSVPVVPGTDVLKLRGIFNSPIFRVDAAEESTFEVDGSTATLVVDSMTRSGFEQPLDALKRLKSGADVSPEALVIVSREGDAVWAVVELADLELSTITVPVPGSSIEAERATLTLNVTADQGTHAAEYLALSSGGTFPGNLTSVAFVGVLEEYWHYVAQVRTVPGDPASPLAPKLARARMVPGSTTVHAAPDSVSIEVADRILDLQVAFGIDLDGDGQIDERDDDGDPLAAAADEWRWNDPADDPALPWDAASLLLVRASVLGRTARAEGSYVDAPLPALANRVYGELAAPASAAELADRHYRRRIAESDIRLRD